MRKMLMVVVCLSILGMVFVLKVADSKQEQKGHFEIVAIPVKSVLVTSIWAGPDAQGRSGKSIYLFTPSWLSQQLYCLRVDPDTGMCESFYTGTPGNRPNATQSTSTDNDGWFYGDWNTMRYRFNPKTGALQDLEDMGLWFNRKTGKVEKKPEEPIKQDVSPSSSEYTLVSGIVTTPDGKQYSQRRKKSEPQSGMWMSQETEPFPHFWVYDPKTGEEKDLGVVPERKWWQYPMGPTLGPNGKMYFSMAIAEPDIIVYNPKTGKQKSILPAEYRKYPGWAITGTDSKGNLYYFLYANKLGLEPRYAFRVEDETVVQIPLKDWPGGYTEEMPYTSPEPPSCTLADGRKVSLIYHYGSAAIYELEDRALRIQDPKTGKERILRYDYVGAPQYLFGKLSKGPDGKIYGAADAHLFCYDPKTGKGEEIGNTNLLYNQVYGTLFHRGKFYTMTYGNAVLGVYNPTKPWRYGKDKEANPRDLGFQGGPGGLRPFDMILGPDRMIYTVSCPINGFLGGSLMMFDPKTSGSDNFKSKYWWNEVIKNHALMCLTLDPDGKGFWVGSAPLAVSAGDETRSELEAKIALWDIKTEKTAFECVPIPGMLVIRTLLTAPNGLIYGIGALGDPRDPSPDCTYGKEGIMFVFDPKTRKVVHQIKMTARPGEQSRTLELGPDGLIYGVMADPGSDTYVFTIDPKDNSVKDLGHFPRIRGGPLVDGKNIYFLSDYNLVRYVLP